MAAHQHAQGTNAETICYLHNCAKMHDGKPCPMTVVAKPGEKVTCPVCGEHILEAAEMPAGESLIHETPEGYAPVLVTPQQRQLIGVTTAPAKVQPLDRAVRATGVIAHDPELYQTQAEFIQAVQGLRRAEASGAMPEIIDQATRLVSASRLRLRHLGLSETMIDEVAGWTEPDNRLLLGGAGQYWVYASIYEYELPLVRQGQEAAVTSDSLPGRSFTGTVKAIDPMLNSETRTTRVRLLVEDASGELKPGMYVNTAMAVGGGDALIIPKSAVFSTGERQLVFVDKGEGLFEPRQVTLGMTAGDQVEVLSGVVAGEPVVTSGNFLIDSESRLRGSLQGAAGAHQHGGDPTPTQPKPVDESPQPRSSQHVH